MSFGYRNSSTEVALAVLHRYRRVCHETSRTVLSGQCSGVIIQRDFNRVFYVENRSICPYYDELILYLCAIPLPFQNFTQPYKISTYLSDKFTYDLVLITHVWLC